MKRASELLLDMEPVVSSHRCGLIVDVDGTISPITDQPEVASADPVCADMLRGLVGRLPLVAALSGRTAADAYRMVGVEGMIYLGNHGLEQLLNGQVQVDPRAMEWAETVREQLQWAFHALERVPGLVFEEKGVTGAIHYRQSPDPALAREMILAWCSSAAVEHGLRLAEGKMVVELRPPLDVNKGTAVRRLVEEHALGGVVYMGDDITDIDAFLAIRDLRHRTDSEAFGIAVLDSGTPQEVVDLADAVANGIHEVEDFLVGLAFLAL